MEQKNWYEIADPEDVVSPALLVYPDRIRHNIRTMLEMAGGAEHLRPHIKTHKTAEIIEMQLAQGIRKFKCATIAEAELLALCKAPDILLALQPVGPDVERFFRLMDRYPKSIFSTLVDNRSTLNALSEMAKSAGVSVSLWMDLNTGMDRTGIVPAQNAIVLYRQMNDDPNVEARGLHVYDGHIRDTDPLGRKEACDRAFAPVLELQAALQTEGVSVKGIVAGGSPTFPFHAQRNGVETSPGTTLLWDTGYGDMFPEMDFLPAGVLLTRVISRPKKHTVCLDLGHKHLAPEMPLPRVRFLNIENSIQKGQSEEHFVLECENSDDYAIGTVCYALPVHICPTVAKYENLQVVSEGQIIDIWKVAARNQRITI